MTKIKTPRTAEGEKFYYLGHTAATVNDAGDSVEDLLLSQDEKIELVNQNTGVTDYPVFSVTKKYKAGDIVIYEADGRLYKFKSDHEAGIWDTTEVTAWSLNKENTEKLAELGSKVNDINNEIGIDVKLSHGSINPNTGKVQTSVMTRAVNIGYLKSPFKFELNDGYEFLYICKYDSNYGTVSVHAVYQNKQVLTVDEKNDYLYKFSIKRTDENEINVDENIISLSSFGLSQKIDKLNEKATVIDDNKNAIRAIEYDIKSQSSIIDQITTISTIDCIAPQSTTLTEIKVLENGNRGIEGGSKLKENNTYYRIKAEWNNKFEYVLAAVLLTDISDMSLIKGNYKVKLNVNYNTNESYSNTLLNGVVKLNATTAITYVVAGRIETKDNALPTTAYIKVLANTDVSFGISKFLCVELKEWKDEYMRIIEGNALNDSIWTYGTLSEASVVLNRNTLFSGITFWGSSSTEGEWVKDVAKSLNMPFYWGGVGSENIWGIMGRMGVLPMRIKTPITIPSSASEAVELPNNYRLYSRWKGSYKNFEIWGSKTAPSYKLLVNPCYIAGIKGNLVGGGANSGIPLQFQREEDGEAVTTKPYEPIFTYGFRETRDSVWFLACHFNGGQSSTEELVDLYRKMYDTSCSKKVLILGRHRVANGVIESPTLDELVEQETALEDEFGLMFFNTREYMCTRGFERFKDLFPNNYTDTDIEQASQGVTPDCMYISTSNVHFNDKGYTVLKEAVAQRIVQLGYNLFRLGGDMAHPMY